MPSSDLTIDPSAWRLRYAAHLGYRPPIRPLLFEHAGGAAIEDNLEAASRLGLKGMQFAHPHGHDQAARETFARGVRECGLVAGCMLYAPMEIVRRPIWGAAPSVARTEIQERMSIAFDVAEQIGARYIAILSGADQDVSCAQQIENWIENLKPICDEARERGAVLCLEPISRITLPAMLLHHLDDALEIIAKANSDNVRLIFDTAHVEDSDGGAAQCWQSCIKSTVILQLAETSGRTEPGTGDIDFVSILETCMRRQFAGLIELEHHWRAPGVEGETQGLVRLAQIEAAAAAQLG